MALSMLHGFGRYVYCSYELLLVFELDLFIRLFLLKHTTKT